VKTHHFHYRNNIRLTAIFQDNPDKPVPGFCQS